MLVSGVGGSIRGSPQGTLCQARLLGWLPLDPIGQLDCTVPSLLFGVSRWVGYPTPCWLRKGGAASIHTHTHTHSCTHMPPPSPSVTPDTHAHSCTRMHPPGPSASPPQPSSPPFRRPRPPPFPRRRCAPAIRGPTVVQWSTRELPGRAPRRAPPHPQARACKHAQWGVPRLGGYTPQHTMVQQFAAAAWRVRWSSPPVHKRTHKHTHTHLHTHTQTAHTHTAKRSTRQLMVGQWAGGVVWERGGGSPPYVHTTTHQRVATGTYQTHGGAPLHTYTKQHTNVQQLKAATW